MKSGHFAFLQRVRIARNASVVTVMADLSVCPSVRCFVSTNEDTMVRSSATGKTIILVLGK